MLSTKNFWDGNALFVVSPPNFFLPTPLPLPPHSHPHEKITFYVCYILHRFTDGLIKQDEYKI